MSSPAKRSAPLRDGSSPISAPSSVDLPAPLGPMTVTTLFSGAEKLRPCSTSARP
jgi:hypothetical protein